METSCAFITNNNSFAQSGYDIPVFGVGHWCFYAIHVTALVCQTMSFISALLVIGALFKSKKKQAFMKWAKHERFLVYRCVCNLSFCVIQMLDHIHVLISLDHVRPPGLCATYSILLIDVCMAESSFSLVSAFNAFLAITFRKNIDFGKRDWKLLVNVCVLGPFSLGLFVYLLDVAGPSGLFCGFDAVKGVLANAILSTGSISTMVVALSVLYVLTWWRIYTESSKLKTLSTNGISGKATVKSAKAMCLFVAVYLIQWAPLSIYGTWQIISEVPFSLLMAVVVSTNLGGILSGIVYVVNAKGKNSVSNMNSAVVKENLKPIQSLYSVKLYPIKKRRSKQNSKSNSNKGSHMSKQDTFSTPTTERF